MSNKLLDYCKDNMFLTGSRAIGGFTEKSDFDFVCFPSQHKEFCGKFNLPIEDGEPGSLTSMFLSLKFQDYSEVVNLIIVDELSDYECWVDATIKTTIKKPHDRAERVYYFGQYLLEGYELFKDLNPESKAKYNTAFKLWGSS